MPSHYSIKSLEECGGALVPHEFNGKKSPFSEVYENHIDFIQEFNPVCRSECDKECESVLFNEQVVTTASAEPSFYFSFYDLTTLNITQIPQMNEFSLAFSL